MSVFQLNDELYFPPEQLATEEGIVAWGGDLSAERLFHAYSKGIFPWPHENYPLLWFSPDPRFVLEPSKARINKSLKKAMRKNNYTITFDTDFEKVIKSCCQNKRPEQDGTWITPEVIQGYCDLHVLGFAHSIEAYENNILVGGLYGVSLGGIFFGESMFALKPNASKICFAVLLEHLVKWDFDLVDCQSYTEHLERFGAKQISRQFFLKWIKYSQQNKKTRKGPWQVTR